MDKKTKIEIGGTSGYVYIDPIDVSEHNIIYKKKIVCRVVDVIAGFDTVEDAVKFCKEYVKLEITTSSDSG